MAATTWNAKSWKPGQGMTTQCDNLAKSSCSCRSLRGSLDDYLEPTPSHLELRNQNKHHSKQDRDKYRQSDQSDIPFYSVLSEIRHLVSL